MPQGDFLRDGVAVSISTKLRFDGVDYPPGAVVPWKKLGRNPDGSARPLGEHELRGLWLADRIAMYPIGAEIPAPFVPDPEEQALDDELKRGGIDKAAAAEIVAEASARPPAAVVPVPDIPPERSPGAALATAMSQADTQPSTPRAKRADKAAALASAMESQQKPE